MTGICFDIQRYTIHDGPGIRTTVFLKGCPLTCAWCHNPEGRAREREIGHLADRCIGCDTCREVCPQPEPLAPELCTGCGRCVEACPSGARHWVGEELSVPELMARIGRDRPFYESSGGGVTFSGGEPLLQPEFERDAPPGADGRARISDSPEPRGAR